MAFTDSQTRALAAKLSERHVRTREQNGEEISYIEGWHAIAEANRIFGFGGWSRETLELKCLGQKSAGPVFGVSYLARVRVTVRAGEAAVVREGAGTGHGWNEAAGEAHEMAMKSAETDAMKRALATFGNPFGLALYDSERRGVRHLPRPRSPGARAARRICGYAVRDAAGDDVTGPVTAETFCAAMKERLVEAGTPAVLHQIWARNGDTMERLRLEHAELKTQEGKHHVDVLATLYRSRKAALEEVDTPQSGGDENGAARGPRVRDRNHLQRVAAEPCLICGRRPAEAHHLRFAEPRAMGRKPGDQYTVPLCRMHHQALHRNGNERAWWTEHRVEPLAEARRLWAKTHEVENAS